MITAIIHGGIVTSFFRKYSYNYVFSLFCFIATAEYFAWMFNGIRQFIAVVVILYGIKYLLSKDYIKYCFFVLMASSIHFSSIIMLPIGFAVLGTPWNKKTLIILSVAIMMLFFTSDMTQTLESVMVGTQYEGYTEFFGAGTNIFRVIIYLIPTIFALIFRKKLEEINNQLLNISINMSIISSSLWIISLVTSGILFGRLPIYVGLFNYILLPYIIDNMDNIGLSILYKRSIICLYLIFYITICNTYNLLVFI